MPIKATSLVGDPRALYVPLANAWGLQGKVTSLHIFLRADEVPTVEIESYIQESQKQPLLNLLTTYQLVQQEWVAHDERMPEGDSPLCWAWDGRHVQLCWYDLGTWRHLSSGEALPVPVVAWQPVLQPGAPEPEQR